MVQAHKKFTDEQVQSLLGRYLKHEIERTFIQETLGIGKVKFFALLKEDHKNPHFPSNPYDGRKIALPINKQN